MTENDGSTENNGPTDTTSNQLKEEKLALGGFVIGVFVGGFAASILIRRQYKPLVTATVDLLEIATELLTEEVRRVTGDDDFGKI